MVSDIVSAVTAGVQAALVPLLQSLGQRQDLIFQQSSVTANPSGVTGQSLGQQANRGEGHSCQDPQPPSGGLPMVGGPQVPIKLLVSWAARLQLGEKWEEPQGQTTGVWVLLTVG